MAEWVRTGIGTAAAALGFDAELMLRVKEGDGASFDVLLEKHRSSVVHFLYRMVQNHAVAEELAQEVFLRVYRSRSTYEPTARFTTWLFRIATHLALNALRDGKNERFQERLDDDTSDMPVRAAGSPARHCGAAAPAVSPGSTWKPCARPGTIACRLECRTSIPRCRRPSTASNLSNCRSRRPHGLGLAGFNPSASISSTACRTRPSTRSPIQIG